MKTFIRLVVALTLVIQTAQAQTSYTWNGSVSTAWNTAGNWTPNGIPGAADNVTVILSLNNCVLNATSSINNLTLTTGTLDLGGNTLTVNGPTVTFTTGAVQNGTLTVTNAMTTSFGNGPSTMNCTVNITSATITVKNTTFQGTTNITKNGASSDNCPGGNTFNGVTTITNAGSGYLLLANNNPDQFNAAATFNNTGSNNLYVAYNGAGNGFSGLTTFNNTPSTNNFISVSQNAAGTVFNNNIVVSSTTGQGVYFCNSGTGAATLTAGNTITIGAGGFSAGTLLLRGFTQASGTAQGLTLTGSGNLTFGPSSTFNGNVTASSPTMFLNGCTFNGTTNITKTGSTGDFSNGGNTFNGVSSITNSGSSYFLLGNNNPDTWNADVTFTDNGSERLLPCWASAGNQFNGNIYVNTAGSATGIQFCGGNNTATATQSGGKTIIAGATGLTAGYLYLKQFTQNGNTPITLTATGSSVMYLGPYSNFGGPVTITAPDIWAQGASYNHAAAFTKTGGSSNHNNQYQNIFNSTCTINQQSNTGYFMLGYNSNDQFNGNITVTSTGTGGINLGWTSGAGTPTMAAGYTINVGAAGFSAGYLDLNTFTQLGNAPLNLTFTGTSASLSFARSSVIGGNVTTSTPSIILSGCTFNGTTSFTKTGSAGDWGTGGDVFNGICTITNSGSSYIVMGNNNPDTWNSDVTFTDNGSERILPGFGSVGNQFNGNIYVNTSGSALGIQFCGANPTATATQASGKSVIAGSTGLTAGFLYLKQFTQNGTAPIALTATGNSVIYLGPYSNFGGPVTITAPDIWAQGATYNGDAVFTKTGGSSNHNQQYQNIFNGSCTINQQSSTGYFMLGYNSNDLFNDSIVVTSTGTGGIYLGWTSGTGTPTQASGYAISIGAAGFSAGFLSLNTFTQLGNAPTSLTFTGTNTYLTIARNSVFSGNFAATAPDVYLNGGTFNGSSNFTKTGSNGDYDQGGNTFNGVCSITNSGSSFFLLGNNNPDIWNNTVTFTDNGSERLLPCWASTGNQFNGNIFVNTSGSASGIQFCGGNNTATATQAAGYTIQAGATGLNAGYLILKQFTEAGNAAVNLTLSSTATYLQYGPSSSFGGTVTSSSPGLIFDGSTFNGAAYCTKTGGSNDWGNGNNIFKDSAIITDAGAGYLLMGGGSPDQYDSLTTFNNIGSANLYVAYSSSNNVFNGTTTFTNSPTGNNLIYVSTNSIGTSFNGNIIVNSTAGQGVQFCTGNNTATATLTSGYAISIGSAGFSVGTLLLRQFTQLGPTPQSFTLTGTGILTYGPSSNFSGNVTSSSPTLYLNGCTFNGTSNITKTGPTGDYSNGGNIFNGVCSITNSGSSFLLLGNSSPDIWNNDVTFTDNGSERLLPCWATTGNQFNGNIFVNTAGSAAGIQFCGGNTTATATQAAGFTIQAGAIGLNEGYLILKQFTQLGNAAVNLTLNSTATYLQYGPASTFGGNVVSSSPGLYFEGATFNGTATCTKTGASNDGSIGNNVFNGVANITNAGAGYLLFANGNRDQFNTDATFNNTGSNIIYVAYNSPNNIFGGTTTFNNTPTANTAIYVSQYSVGTVFNGNMVVTSTAGQGVQFCTGNGTATATLASGNTISVGAGGFSAGALLLRQFTQAGATPQSLTLTGTGNLTFGPASAFGGNTTTVSPTLFFNGCDFGGTVTSTKNGSSNDGSIGNNVFNGAFNVTNTGAGYFVMGNGNADIWESTATFNNYSSAQHMYIAYNSTGNTFNGNVVFNNQPGSTGLWIYPNYYGINTVFNGNISVNNIGGAGVYFGANTGTATLTTGYSIGVGASGFSSGTLVLRNFTQTDAATAQNIVSTGTSLIQYGPTATFSGPVTSSSPGLLFDGVTFNGTVNATKTGASNDQSAGGNTFNAASTFTNTGTGYLLMTNTTPDAYNSDVTFTKSGSGAIYPNYNGISPYAGNLTVNAPAASAITFGANTGTAILTGASVQNINAAAGSSAPIFTRLVVNNTGGGVTLNTTGINVSSSLTMTTGLLNTSSTYLLTMMNGSTTAAGNSLSTSYVNGPMRYQKSSAGSTTLNFPLGTSPDCRPIVLTVNHSNGTLYNYTATLYNASALALGYSMPPSITTVSVVHYWIISRTDASGTSQPVAALVGNQTIQLFFGADDFVIDGTNLVIAKNTYLAPTAWINIGGMGGPAPSGGAYLTGSITSTSAPTAFNSFSTFTLANPITGANVLPMTLMNFTAKPDNGQVDLAWVTATESNNNYFTVEKSKDGISFDSLVRVNSQAIDGNSSTPLDYTAVDPSPYMGLNFYRLKQTNLDGSSIYSNVVTVDFEQTTPVNIYPNPSAGTLYISGLGNVTTQKVEWYDLGGHLVIQQMVSVSGGIASLNVHLANGAYFVKFQTADGNFVTKNVLIMR